MNAESYLKAVAADLRLPHAAKKSALDDLRDLLRGIDDPVATLGTPEEYADALNADAPEPTILGMPNSFLPGFAKRIAGTFDPANPKILVPRVVGAGWGLNTGALAVRLGLLNADDLDDETAELAAGDTAVRLAAALPAVASLAVSARALWSAESLAEGAKEVFAAGAMAKVALVLDAVSASGSVGPRERLALPGLAAGLGVLALGSQLTKRRAAGLGIVAVAAVAMLAADVVPVRRAIARQV